MATNRKETISVYKLVYSELEHELSIDKNIDKHIDKNRVLTSDKIPFKLNVFSPVDLVDMAEESVPEERVFVPMEEQLLRSQEMLRSP